MKYMGMPMGMWALFAGSFQKQLTAVFGYDADAAQAITKKAKPKYKAIIADLPEFEKSGPLQDEHRQLRNARRVHSLHAAAPGGRPPDGLLRKGDDDSAHAVVLP